MKNNYYIDSIDIFILPEHFVYLTVFFNLCAARDFEVYQKTLIKKLVYCSANLATKIKKFVTDLK